MTPRSSPTTRRRLAAPAFAAVTAFASILVVGTASADDDPQPVPQPAPAYGVIHRGAQNPTRALGVALGPVWQAGDRRRHVTLVVDPTEHLRAAEEAFVAALFSLDDRADKAGSWRLRTLGETDGTAAARPSALTPDLLSALAPRDVEPDTLTALRRTAQAAPRGSVIVYIADVHFEDERDIEGLARLLVSRDITLSVVGPEAAFGRAWNDGFFPPYRGETDAHGEKLWYDPNVCRAPLAQSPDAPPWHGGDTALPLAPTHFGSHWEERLFSARTEIDTATGETVRRGVAHAYPSGWGPWCLMRLAAVTGGRYVIWSARPGEPVVTYDGTKLDALAPDLRARRDVLAAAADRPLRAATLRTWGELTDATSAAFRATPPVRADLETSLEMAEPRSDGHPPTILYERDDHERMLRTAPALLRLLDGAVRHLDRAISRAGTPADDRARRDLADARLMVHVLRCQRFSWGEAWARGRRLMPRPWRAEDELVPALITVRVAEHRAGAQWVATDVDVADAARWAALLAERRDLITAYAGTPWGEMVARNRVVTYELRRVPLASGAPSGGGEPVDSGPRPPDVTPSGGTSGPSTGR